MIAGRLYFDPEASKQYFGVYCDKCTPKQQKIRNCDGSNPKNKHIVGIEDPISVDHCPIHCMKDCGWLISTYMRYAEHGTMPNSGGFNDQPNLFCQSVEILDPIRRRYKKQDMRCPLI